MNEFLQIVFSGIVAFSTIVYAVLTWKLVTETKKIRQVQITPDIHAFFEKSQGDSHYVYIVIENIGFGIATNVKIEIIKDFKTYDNKVLQISDKGVFKYGVKKFYPKQRFRYLFTNMSLNQEKKIVENMELQIIFEDINNKKFTKSFDLTLDEFTGMGFISPPDSHLGRVSYELKKIREILKSHKKQ